MAGFKGQAEYSVDAKGRVAIPAKMRNALSPEAKGTFTVTRGFERCVYLYPQDHWEKMEGEMRSLNMYDRSSRQFLREILMWADEASLDAQGRISIPKPLADRAGIEFGQSVLVIGALEHIEIWNPEIFKSYQAEHDEEYVVLAERRYGAGAITWQTMPQNINDKSGSQEQLPHASTYHIPVLCTTVINGLVTDLSGIYVDATLGGGGHSEALLSVLNREGRVVGIDQDKDALEAARKRLSAEYESGRFLTVRGNFGDLGRLLDEVGIDKVNGLLLDLGVSSHQLDTPGRGFSYRLEGDLDMRMDQRETTTAHTILNTWPEEELAHILWKYGELRQSRRLASDIVASRPLESTLELKEVIGKRLKSKDFV